jgi:hypothetical protein
MYGLSVRANHILVSSTPIATSRCHTRRQSLLRHSGRSQWSIALQPLPSNREIIRVFLTLCSEYNTNRQPAQGALS